VPIGLRLLDGGLTLQTALLVLLLAPEAYLPLRVAGSKFHASMEGLTALDQAFSVLEQAPVAPSGRIKVAPAMDRIRFEGVTVAYERTVALRDATFSVAPGERVAIVGPSGAGKSTLLALLLGFTQPTSGRVLIGDTDLATVDIEAWRRNLAWVPQRPYLFAASLADNIRLGAPDASPAAVAAAVSAAHLDEVVAALPDGLDTVLGERGHGLSSGQRQRVALARAFLRDAPLLLLDEPTARLDGASEALVLAATRRLAQGRTALLVAHRPALLADVDRVLRVDEGRVIELTTAAAA
jgi:ATP-binding cassette subfamily C protein CydD